MEENESHSPAENKKSSESEDDTGKDVDLKQLDLAPKTFIEVLPSKAGTILAALLTNIMTQGLTAGQQNILGNFISSVGSLISYKASRDELDDNNK